MNDESEGGIWCIGGNIVDARCGPLVGDDAAYELLALETGDFSVGFGRIERPRTVTLSTESLLIVVARRKEQRVSVAPPAVAPKVSMRPSEHTMAATFRPGARRDWLQQLVAVAALGLIGAAAWEMLAPSSSTPKAAPMDGSPAAAPVAVRPVAPAELFIDIEVEPDRAGIWLDGERVGTGHLRQRLPYDGRTHQLQLVAPGYAAQTLVFREEAPSRLLRLERLIDPTHEAVPSPAAAAPAVVTLPSTARPDDSQQHAHIEHAAPTPAARAASPVGKDVGTAHAPDAVQAKANGSLVANVEPARPRIQVISDRDLAKPKVQIVDTPEPSRMKVQIIDDDSPRVHVIE